MKYIIYFYIVCLELQRFANHSHILTFSLYSGGVYVIMATSSALMDNLTAALADFDTLDAQMTQDWGDSGRGLDAKPQALQVQMRIDYGQGLLEI